MPDVRLTQFYYLLCRVVFKYYMVVLCTYSFCTYFLSTCERGTHIMENAISAFNSRRRSVQNLILIPTCYVQWSQNRVLN